MTCKKKELKRGKKKEYRMKLTFALNPPFTCLFLIYFLNLSKIPQSVQRFCPSLNNLLKNRKSKKGEKKKVKND